jgi:hypothetical protein
VKLGRPTKGYTPADAVIKITSFYNSTMYHSTNIHQIDMKVAINEAESVPVVAVLSPLRR